MQITTETTVKSLLDQYPEAVQVFQKHGVELSLECDESVWDTPLSVCDSMCHIDDIDALITDLQNYVNSKS